jgi:hypothetical protein
MERSPSTPKRAVVSGCSSHDDDVSMLVRQYAAVQSSGARSPAERWALFSRRIRAHQYLESLIAQMTANGPAAQQAALMSRFWPSLTLPIT